MVAPNFHTYLKSARLPSVRSNYRPFAHHPHCESFNNHLVWIFGHPVCLGCLCMYSGGAIGALIASQIDFHQITLLTWIAVHAAGVLPTALQPFYQKKIYKIFSRSVLGISTGSYFVSGIFLYNPFSDFILWSASLLTAFGTVYYLMRALRKSVPNDPCSTCTQGHYPTCDWYLPTFLSQNTQDPLLAKASMDAPSTNVSYIETDT